MKKLMSIMIVAAVATLFAAWPAQAVDYFKDSGVTVSGEPSNGRIHIKGAPADIEKYARGMGMMSCPDQLKDASGATCNINWPVDVQRISPNEAVLQLDMKAVAEGKRAFNFESDGLWSQAFAGKAGENIVVESSKDGQGYCHYTYIGDLPEGSYTPYKPELCGEHAVQPAVAKVIKPTAAPAASAPATAAPAAKKPPRTPHHHKKPAVAKAKTDTARSSVGEIDKTDPLDEQTLQQKSRKILQRIAAIEKSVAALEKSAGVPAAGETVLGLLKNIDQKMTAPEPKKPIKAFWDRWNEQLLGLILAVLIFLCIAILVSVVRFISGAWKKHRNKETSTPEV